MDPFTGGDKSIHDQKSMQRRARMIGKPVVAVGIPHIFPEDLVLSFMCLICFVHC